MKTPRVTLRHRRVSAITGWFMGAMLVVGLALLASWLKSATTTVAAGAAPQAQPTPENLDSALVYVQADVSRHASRIAQGGQSASVAAGMPAQATGNAPLATASLPPGCVIGGLYAAPQGQWLAQQVDCEDSGFVQVVQTASGQVQNVASSLGPDSLFLNWLPSGPELAVKVDLVGNSRVYVINLASGQANRLPVPPTTYDVAFSPNGWRLLYALTQGLGFGSEVWLADANGRNARRVLADQTHIIAYARWSPAGDALAYIRMPDSNIPFTVGELWTADGDGNQAVMLGEADAGHGYAPSWSPDGAQVAYVGRENKTDVAADQVTDRLVSNIYVADVKGRKITNLTQFSGALAENPTWSPDGAALAFSANAGGQGMDLWTFDVKGKRVAQVTRGANARYPAWLKGQGQVVSSPVGAPVSLTPEANEMITPTLEFPTIAPTQTMTATETMGVTPTLLATATLTGTPTLEIPTVSPTGMMTATATLAIMPTRSAAAALTLTGPLPTETLNPITVTMTLTR